MAKKKSQRVPKGFGEALGLKNILSSETTDFLIGLLAVVASILIIIAMVSFIKTGQADQSILEDLRPGEWTNSGQIFANACGSFGAIIAYTFITLCFGLPSFLIPFFFILVGLKLMRIYEVNLWKWFFCLAIIMVWSSVTFAKFLAPIMADQVYNPGGNHGVYCVQHLENVMGVPGLTCVLVFTAIAFLTFLSSETMTWVRKTLNPVKYLTNKVKVTITNTLATNDAEEDEQAPTSPAEEENQESTVKTSVVEEEEAAVTNVFTDVLNGHEQDSKKTLSTPQADKEAELTVEVGKADEVADESTVNNDDIDLSTPINPKEPFIGYKYPTLSLLKKYDNAGKPTVNMDEIKANNEQIVKVLKNFSVEITEIRATIGPTITLYEITPGPGVRISKIRNLQDDIALSLKALGVRIIAPIPGKGTVGIEVPNRKANIVSMESILNTKKFQETKFDLPIALGKTITNEVYMVDLAKIPHLLVAGATGQGKSVGLNAIITSLLYKKHPNELKFVMVDPKKVEFSIYAPIADHFMATLPENDEDPIITDVNKVVRTLKSLCTLMDHRYDMLKMAGARNIKEYNEKFVNHKLDLTKGHEYMPYIVVVIDEFGDLIMTAGKDIEMPIARIAQLARAVGIHMIIATQRPTTSIITGNIKANFPGRMAFKVSAMIDSRTILDSAGADKLIGRGDMLILNGREPDAVRVQCAFVDTPEVEQIAEYISKQSGPVEPMELPEPENDGNDGSSTGSGGGSGDMGELDPYFAQAARFVVTTMQGSTSKLQRKYEIGYNRAGRLMDQLEKAGIVGAAHGSKPREVLITDEGQLNILLQQYNFAH